jgi:hypothetical protein
MSTLIASHDGNIPHLVSPRLVDGCQPGSGWRTLAGRRAALPAASLVRPPPGAGPSRRPGGGLAAARPQPADQLTPERPADRPGRRVGPEQLAEPVLLILGRVALQFGPEMFLGGWS